MADDLHRAKFQDIEDFLKALASGVAQGNKALEDAQAPPRASEFGTLVIKEGEISAQFEISSQSVKDGIEGPGLGVRTIQPLLPMLPVLVPFPFAGPGAPEGTGQPQNQFLGLAMETHRRVSEAKITLKLVRIASTPGEAAEPGPTREVLPRPDISVRQPEGPLVPLEPFRRPEVIRPEPIPSTPAPGETPEPPTGETQPPSDVAQPPVGAERPSAGPAKPPDIVVRPPGATAPPSARAAPPPASAPQPPSATPRPQAGPPGREAPPPRRGRRQPSRESAPEGIGLPAELREAAAGALQNALANLSVQMPFLPVSEQQRRSIIVELDRVGALLEQGDIEAATEAFARFAQQYGPLFGAT